MELGNVYKYNYLGVIVDDKLLFDEFERDMCMRVYVYMYICVLFLQKHASLCHLKEEILNGTWGRGGRSTHCAIKAFVGFRFKML